MGMIYKPSSEGLYKPTKMQLVKKKITEGFSNLNTRLEKDREAYKEQREIEKQANKEFIDKIKFKREQLKRKEKERFIAFRKKNAKKFYRGIKI